MMRGTLNDPALRPFPLNAVEPRGWLAAQLRIQADGLSGHLDEFWPDIKDSAWIGGRAEGWERMPYWLDGVISLAWLLGDEPLKRRITGYLDYIIRHQHGDGWLGPRVEQDQAASDIWSQALALKMLVVYHDASGDDRVPDCVRRALVKLERYIDKQSLGNWGQFRWFEFLIPIWWLHERTGEAWLLDLAVHLHARGFDWSAFFEHWPLMEPTEKKRWNLPAHVVNNAMALKQGPLWWRLSGRDADRGTVHAMLAALDRYHGTPTGMFTGDECLAGTSAVQGTELCAVVETMYALECALGVLGDASLADRLETIAFNALPATFSPDMWAHQYDQQVNQIECSVRAPGVRPWNTNGPDANIFGLEPNFGCCTANLSQGWPKFAAHLWMRAQDGGIAAVAFAPSRLKTRADGADVVVTLETGYPFRQELLFTVETDRPARFPLLLRIPAWAAGATVETEEGERTAAEPGRFLRIEREWQGRTSVRLSLPAVARVVSRPNGAVSIRRGALLYALAIGEDWRRIHEDQPFRELPHADWEVYPTTPWNYALELGDDGAVARIRFTEQEIGSPVFSPQSPPITARVKGRRAPDWSEQDGSAQPAPHSPVQTEAPSEELQLIPYGCTNLRIAEFPIVRGQTERDIR